MFLTQSDAMVDNYVESGEQVKPTPQSGEVGRTPPKSKKKTRVRVISSSGPDYFISLRNAERMDKHLLGKLDREKLTLRKSAVTNDMVASGRVFKRLQQVNRTVTLDVAPFTEPVDPFGIPTNRIGLPVVPHYSGRSLDDYLDHAEHDARQKAS